MIGDTMKQRNRYDLTDTRAYDGRPVKRSTALSPRVPTTVRTSGRPAYAPASDPRAGRHGTSDGARRPRLNTMSNARHGGSRIRYYEPAELARETLTHTNAHVPARINGRKYDPAMRPAILAAAEHEGYRQAAMQAHSQMRTTGAVATVKGRGPVWSQETNQSDHIT